MSKTKTATYTWKIIIPGPCWGMRANQPHLVISTFLPLDSFSSYFNCFDFYIEKFVARSLKKIFRLMCGCLKVGMMLEVLDISNGGVFYAGYVSEVLSPYYFLVRVSQSIKGPAPEMLCHRSHPYIFPVYWCARHNIRLTPPEGQFTPSLKLSHAVTLQMICF